MSQYYAKSDEAGMAYDRNLLIKELIKYYDSTDLDEIGLKLKEDLISAPKLKALLKGTGFEKEELILHVNCIFDALFNQSIIRKIRQEMKKI